MWKWACLVPHPPIIVPEVGHGREKEAHQTLNGMKELTYHLKNQKPDILFLLSPHAPQGSGLFFLETSCYAGDLSMFGAPQEIGRASCRERDKSCTERESVSRSCLVSAPLFFP